MDPFSHALLGRALNSLDTRRRLGRGAAAACVLGSLAPDIDIGLVARGWDIYLQYHGTVTHTIAASPLLAAGTAAVVRLCVRGSVYTRLFVAALIGVIVGHVLFDLVSGSDISLFAPLSFRVFDVHLLAMADLTAVAVIVAGTLLSVWRRTAGGVAVVVGLAALLVVKLVSLQVASRVYERAAAPVAVVARREAINGSLMRWQYYDRRGDLLRAWIVDAWRRQASLAFTRPATADFNMDSTRNLPAVRRFLGFAAIPFARVDRLNGERCVLWSDLSYCDAERCVMSFGAIVDERGAPLCEIVQLGGYLRTRPLADNAAESSPTCRGQ